MEMHATKSIFKFFEIFLIDLIDVSKNWRISLDVIIKQVYFTGFQALSLVLMISLFIGVSIIWGGHTILENFGQTKALYTFLISGLISDLAPILISLILLLRSGSAMTVELGYMKVNQEVASLRAMGISPVAYLVTPRVIGAVLSALILSSYFAFNGIITGYIVTNFIKAIQFNDFLRALTSALTLTHIVLMIAKITFSSLAMVIICCYQGLKVETSFTEMPQRVILALTRSLIAIILINFIFSLVYLIV